MTSLTMIHTSLSLPHAASHSAAFGCISLPSFPSNVPLLLWPLHLSSQLCIMHIMYVFFSLIVVNVRILLECWKLRGS